MWCRVRVRVTSKVRKVRKLSFIDQVRGRVRVRGRARASDSL